MLRAEAWGRQDDYREGGPYPGTRLFCSTPVLKKILTKHDKDLLVLIRVRRYEKETWRRGSQYNHTVAVARITKAFQLEYFKGRINHLHKTKY